VAYRVFKLRQPEPIALDMGAQRLGLHHQLLNQVALRRRDTVGVGGAGGTGARCDARAQLEVGSVA
jgi:hypothetical protein